jgi:hypothetical protein
LRFVTTDLRLTSLFPLLRWLGYGGLIPFAALAAGSLLLSDPALRVQCLLLLQVYGLSIISFVGAISWGIALMASNHHETLRRQLFLWSVVPSLIGCASILLSASAGCLLLAATAALAFVVDMRTLSVLGLPVAWRRLRLHLTAGAIIALLTGAQAARGLGS